MLADLVLGFGDHYYETQESGFWASVFQTMLGAFFGFLGALLIDRIAAQRSEAEKAKKLVAERISQLKYFRDSIDAVLLYVPQQLEAFKGFAEELRQKPLEIVIPPVRATFDLLRLKDIDTIDNRNAFFEFFGSGEESIKNYRNTIAYADYLFRLFSSTETNNTRSIDFKHADQKKVRDCMDEITMLLGLRLGYLESVGQDGSDEGVFLGALADNYQIIIDDFMNFSDSRSMLIEPLFLHSIGTIGDPIILDKMFPLCRKAMSLLRSIEANSLNVASEYDNFGNQTSDAVVHLQKVKEELDNLLNPEKES